MVEQTIVINGKKFSTVGSGTYLYLDMHKLTSLPEGIFDKLVKLTNLNLSKNNLSSLPEGIFDKLVKLTKLNLSYNKLTSLPKGIFDNLINLKRLYLNNNNISSLPHNIFDNLVRMEYLDIRGTDLISLPSGIFDSLAMLSVLHLSENNLISLPSGIFDNLMNLKRLYLNNNNISSLPHNIFDNLVNLESLSLSRNNISSLPSGIFDNLMNLTTLDLSRNNLDSLPDGIFNNLMNLKSLSISGNSISSLPDGIFDNLVNLEYLELSNSNLTSLPLSLRNCRRLEMFYYDNNPIEYIPPQVQRFLNRMKNRAIQSISKDNQNVHNSAIQSSLNTSISNLMKEKPALTTEEVVTFITNSEFITPEAKSYLLTYSEDETVHSVHGVTFSEVLTSVISEIISMKEKDEVLKILSEEISDSICKCFTGRISRLVNSLNGFSPKVKVEISKNTQISTILAQASERISKIETEEEINKIKEETIKNLREHDFTEEEIEDWMSYL